MAAEGDTSRIGKPGDWDLSISHPSDGVWPRRSSCSICPGEAQQEAPPHLMVIAVRASKQLVTSHHFQGENTKRKQHSDLPASHKHSPPWTSVCTTALGAPASSSPLSVRTEMRGCIPFSAAELSARNGHERTHVRGTRSISFL